MRILIADDSELVRRGVTAILTSKTDWEICGQAANGQEAIQKARELWPDLVLLDISMPGLDGLQTARLLRQELPDVKIVIMSQHDPVHLLPGALEAGASACVDKSRLSTDLVTTVGRVMETPEVTGAIPMANRSAASS
jgi:two-component system response regulator NreC